MSQLLLQEKRQLNSVSKFIETAMERHHNREMKSGTGKKGKLYFYYRHASRTRKFGCPHPTSFPAEELDIFYLFFITNLTC